MAEIGPAPTLTPTEIGALAHLYRGELYRSKIWRTRLDTTTNWAVGTTGIALSITFSSAEVSPLPLLLVSLLIFVFLGIEARRYRYFDIWRTRVRILETSFYGPILRGQGIDLRSAWNLLLAEDYDSLQFKISYIEAYGRRLRRNYIWIFGVLGLSYFIKIIIHPYPLITLAELFPRAAIGPIGGEVVVALIGATYIGVTVLAVCTLGGQKAVGRVQNLATAERELLRSKLQI